MTSTVYTSDLISINVLNVQVIVKPKSQPMWCQCFFYTNSMLSIATSPILEVKHSNIQQLVNLNLSTKPALQLTAAFMTLLNDNAK